MEGRRKERDKKDMHRERRRKGKRRKKANLGDTEYASF